MATDQKMSKYLRKFGPSIDLDLVAKGEAELAALSGKQKHFCPDWDYMAIDETCREFEACTCVFQTCCESVK